MNVPRFLMSPAILIATTLVFAGGFAGCDDHDHKKTKTAHKGDDHAHGPDGKHVAPAAPVAGHGGPVIDLGSAISGAFDLKATRDQGLIEAGKDAPIDVTVMPSAGSAAKPTGVRFWIGTENAKGSVKAKAEVENPAEPNRWHTHTEIPDPLPAGAELWVEIESDDGAKSVTGFDLKR